MAFNDLREFINRLEEQGELVHITTSVDWKYELTGWIHKSAGMQPVGPAMLFENIKDYPGGRLFSGALANHSRISTLIGLDPKTSHKELVDEFTKRIQNPIPTKLVAAGPVKENIITGDDIDLYKFPVPYWNPLDGGRYIGTYHGCVTKNPSTGIQNVGAYRMQILDKKSAIVGFLPFTDIGDHFAQCVKNKVNLPMAMVIGADESVNIVAGMKIEPYISEFDVAGALRGEAIELVKCETIDIEVPANAEFVIEGIIRIDKTAPEGPFGEYPGYHGGGIRVKPIFEITAICHRNNPILRGCVLGKPPTEHHVVMDVVVSSATMAKFRQGGPEGVIEVNCPPAANSLSMMFIKMKPRYVGHARAVGRALFALGPKSLKYCIIVDDDIDILNMGQVLWAMVTRTQGSRDFEILPFCPMSRSDPSIPANRGEYSDKVIIDATKKLDYPYNPVYGGHWAPVCVPPDEVIDLVDCKWELQFGDADKPGLDDEVKKLTDIFEGKFEYWEKWREKAYAITEDQMKEELKRSLPML